MPHSILDDTIDGSIANVVRSCGMDQLGDDLRRHDNDTVQSVQYIDRSDQGEVVERRAAGDDDGHRDEARAMPQ